MTTALSIPIPFFLIYHVQDLFQDLDFRLENVASPESPQYLKLHSTLSASINPRSQVYPQA
ncbi:hypothetical protein K435DRAFT_778601 [Dendrothele bispora CBS 962.96]|uniref:Uncharacterized protein n=1 Tax=Dendrothele bispora (strain CBS 962.96) TaxID=1314807 RepID=A0A4S8M2V6_DENBC|nr:hypothetical protein K435DRAFT_778601 [Dendrothele bispora CBS 962.96]